MRRRDKGSGYLARKPRADGRWPASFVGSDGKRVYLSGQTKAEVKGRLTAATRDRDAGLFVTGPAQTVAEFLGVWMRHKRASGIAPRTIVRYEGLIAQHIIPAIGSRQLRKVMPQHVADLYLALGERLAPATVAQVHAILHGAFKQAVAWHAIARNPVGRDAGVVAPKSARREMRFLDTRQTRELLTAIVGDPLEALYVTAVFTGLRLGELVALRWRDVDLEGRALTVHHTLTRSEGAWILRQPKTPASRRTVRLAPAVVDALRAHYLAEAERLLAMGHRIDADAMVFSDRWGDPVNPWHVTERAFKPLLRRAGLPVIRFHDLRHTFASMMLSEGVRVDIVSKMLGHSTPAITLGIYAHLMPGDEEAAVDRLQTRIGG